MNESIWKPHVTVAAVLEREGRFLVVEEQTDDGVRLNQPAGHLEANESIVDGAVREAMEETAYRFEPRHVVGIYRWQHPSGVVYLRFAFTGPIVAHEAGRILDQGILRALWLTPDELRAEHARHRSPLVMRCVDDYLTGRRFPLELLAHL
ncbi:MAG: NUDIX hydrolase [Betaproteobacteria bacterium]